MNDLKDIAYKVRQHIIRMSTDGVCFVGASLSAADLIVYLYTRFLNVNKDNLTDPNRDYLFLSKGHDVPALYGTFAEIGAGQEVASAIVYKGEIEAEARFGQLTGGPDALSAAFADGRAVTIPRRDHMTAVGDFPRIALGIGVMCVFVMGLNHFVWRRLYALAEDRMHF